MSPWQNAIDILGFEDNTHWSSTLGTVASSTDAVQGDASAAVNGPGWQVISSVPFGPLPRVDEEVTVALKLPSAQPNPWWYGQILLYVEVPSLGMYNRFIAAVELTGRPLGQFFTVEFALPSDVIALLSLNDYNDLVVKLALNVPYNASGTYLLDDLRFGDDVLPPIITAATDEETNYGKGPFETFNPEVTLLGHVVDEIGIADVAVSIDGGAAAHPALDANGYFSLPLDLVADLDKPTVTHLAEITARDTSGNETTLEVEIVLLSPTVPNELVVLFNKDTTEAKRLEVLAGFDGTFLRRLNEFTWLISVPNGTAPSIIDAVEPPTTEVRAIFPNVILKPQFIPDDGLIESQLAYLENINALDAWDIETGSQEVIVAVVDSGIDYPPFITENGCDGADEYIDNIYLNESECCANPPCNIDNDNDACVPGADNNFQSPSGLDLYGDCPRIDQNGDGCPGVCGVDDDNDGAADMQDPDVEKLYSNGYDDDGDGHTDEQAIVGGVTKPCASAAPGELVNAPHDGDCDGAANDDDENGYPDDCRGWNFGRIIIPDCRYEPDPIEGLCLESGSITHPNQPMDVFQFQSSDHGTRVAQIIGNPGNDCGPYAGIAHRVKILPLNNTRYFPTTFEEPGRMIPDLATTFEAYQYAGKAGAHIINSSFTMDPVDTFTEQFPSLAGVTGNQMVTDLMALSGSDAALHVMAVGNLSQDTSEWITFPVQAAIENKLVVGASDPADDSKLASSNYGSHVDLAAPGKNLIQGFANTSGAAPQVSGAAALIMSRYPELRGKPELVAEMIRNSVRPVDSWTGLSVTGGILDVAAALDADVPEERFRDNSLSTLPGPQNLATNDVDLFDANNDGLLDFFETTCSRTDVVDQPHLRINEGGVLTDRTASMLPAFQGSFCDAAEGDLNDDGLSDIVLAAFLPDGTPNQNRNRILMNNAAGFDLVPTSDTPISSDAQLTKAVGLCDFDVDGDLDIYFGNVGEGSSDVLMQNDDGTFTDVSSTYLTVPGLSRAVNKVLCADLDTPPSSLCQGLNDETCRLCADPKKSVAGMIVAGFVPAAQESACYNARSKVVPELVLPGSEGFETLLLRQDADGVYQDVSCDLNLLTLYGDPVDCVGGIRAGRQDHDVETADFNNDNAPDLVMISRRGFRNTLLLNNGSGVFTDVTEMNWTIDVNDAREVEVGDVNLDGNVDIVVLRGDPNLLNPGTNMLYLNQGGSVFAEDLTSGFGTNAAITTDGELVDFDNDGDVDLFLGRYQEPDLFLMNTTVP